MPLIRIVYIFESVMLGCHHIDKSHYPGTKFHRDRSITYNTIIILPIEDFFSRVQAIFELKSVWSYKIKTSYGDRILQQTEEILT